MIKYPLGREASQLVVHHPSWLSSYFMAYNQRIEQHEFNDYITQAVWEDDCDACADEPHETNQITHECYVCSEFAPHITTYNYFNLIIYILILIIPIMVIRFFIKKKWAFR